MSNMFDLDNSFCTIKDVYNLVLNSAGEMIDPIYFNAIVKLTQKKIETSNKYMLVGETMDLQSFLALTSLLKNWYTIHTCDVADFIDQKYRDKYAISKADILNVISQAMNRKEDKNPKEKVPKSEIENPKDSSVDMYKVVQNALKNGMTKAAVQKKYKLNQRELTLYEGYKYWSDTQKADHKAMLEYRRLHPNANNQETIVKGCGKDAVGYRFSLIPTQEQQEEYNRNYSEKPKAKIKLGDVKSLILSDKEKEEQDALYKKIKEIANARNTSPREVSTAFKARLTRDYGIVIDQIKKDLMIKYRVNHGEGKAPNALEALAMSEYLPVAKSVLDAMLEESYTVK